MARTSEKLQRENCPVSTSGPEDSRVKTFQSAASKAGLTEAEVDSFLRLLGSSKARSPKIAPNGLSLKMLKISYPFTEDGTLQPFSIRWPHSAIVSSTDFSIQNSTAFRTTETEFTLSLIDILEPIVDEKYFLSSAATARLLYS